jgi:hypothetical protein
VSLPLSRRYEHATSDDVPVARGRFQPDNRRLAGRPEPATEGMPIAVGHLGPIHLAA